MNQDLDYAEMLEIPVSTVTVTKKKSFFKRRQKAAEPAPDELKELVVDSVNERVGAYVSAEDVSDPPKKSVFRGISYKKDKESMILIGETVAVCAIALGIFLTNIFMPNSAINGLITSVVNPQTQASEPSYNELTLSPVVSANAEADVEISESGVLSFTAACSVYPICDGTVSKISESDGVYTVEISHTSSFSSVITGLTTVYGEEGAEVMATLPFAYTDGELPVSVSLYNGGELLDCYTLADEVPVWKS